MTTINDVNISATSYTGKLAGLNKAPGKWIRKTIANRLEDPQISVVADLCSNPHGFTDTENPTHHHEISDSTKPRYILVKHEYKSIKIPIADIYFFQGKGNYVAIHTSQKVIVALLTMNKLEQLLADYMFFRAHKSFIVSFNHIEAVWNDKVQVQNKYIPIGGQYRDKFLDLLSRNCVLVNGCLTS